METPLTPEKPKRKNDMVHTRGNVDVAFGLMLCAALLMVFFGLDTLIGAVTLRPVYLVSCLVAMIVTIAVLIGQRLIHWIVVLGFIIFFVCSACSPVVSRGALGLMLPAFALIMTAVAVLQWVILRRHIHESGMFSLYILVFTLIAMTYWITMATQYVFVVYSDDVYYHDRYYVLHDLHNSYADTPDHTLMLYACNSVGVACEQIASDRRFWVKSATLQAHDGQTLNLMVDGEVMFSYSIKD